MGDSSHSRLKRAVDLAQRNNVTLRQSYRRVAKRAAIGRYTHAQFKRARRGPGRQFSANRDRHATATVARLPGSTPLSFSGRNKDDATIFLVPLKNNWPTRSSRNDRLRRRSKDKSSLDSAMAGSYCCFC
jgi:hypothetical protein